MKLTLITVTYNSADVLRACLGSMLSLRGRNDLEILVVDDGSTDHTPRAMADLCALFPNLVYLRQEENKGRAVVRNVGLRAAKGDYICFVDSDDFVLANAWDQIEEALEKRPDIVVPQRIDVDKTTRTRRPNAFTDALYGGIDAVFNAAQFPEIFEDNFITGKFYRADFLRAHEITFNDTRKNAEDILFATSVYLHAQHIEVLPVRFYAYTWGGYKAGFSLEKCADVLANTNRLIDEAIAAKSTPNGQVLASKVATILRETIRRATDVVDLQEVRRLYETHIDPKKLSQIGGPRFADAGSKSVLLALKSGDFDQAFRLG